MMESDRTFTSRHLAFVASDRGRAVYDNYLEAAEEAAPHYVDELRGIADGSNINFGHVSIVNSALLTKMIDAGNILGQCWQILALCLVDATLLLFVCCECVHACTCV